MTELGLKNINVFIQRLQTFFFWNVLYIYGHAWYRVSKGRNGPKWPQTRRASLSAPAELLVSVGYVRGPRFDRRWQWLLAMFHAASTETSRVGFDTSDPCVATPSSRASVAWLRPDRASSFPLGRHITEWKCPSVRPSVCPVLVRKSRTGGRTHSKFGGNISGRTCNL